MERLESSHFGDPITAELSEAQPLELPEEAFAETAVAQPEQQPELPTEHQSPEQAYQMLRRGGGDKEILARFEPDQQKDIEDKQKILSSLAYFIGKDFKIPVKLNEPGAGWHWDFKDNIIRVDPKDLLEKPMDYLRFVISHEGGHRRISRTEFIPMDVWAQPGFSIMMNSIEDPRINNFVAENYPKFREQMQMAYQMELDLEKTMKEKATEELGHQPRFIQASFEYIKQWLKEQNGGFGEVSEDLPDEVKEVIAKTLPSAQDSWWRYPSRKEADSSEKTISKYAQTSYEINRDEVWPEFKKLVDQDIEDEKMEQKMRDMQKQSGEGGEGGEPGEGQPDLPQELKDRMTPEQQQELRDALQQAMDKAREQQEQQRSQQTEGGAQENEQQEQTTAPVDLDSLSEETKQAVRDYIESLPEEVKEELAERARQALKEFEEAVNEELRGKLVQEPGEETKDKARGETRRSDRTGRDVPPEYKEEIERYKELVEGTLEKDANVYEEKRREVLETINKLEDDLRAIFVERRAHMWEGGHRSGKHIDIKRRIQEKAKDIPAMESRAWERREMPQEKDYAFSLLVDLSGSMTSGNKIGETFKGAIVLSEVLNRLSIDNEILGFNDRLHVLKSYEEAMSDEIRERMGGMLSEVNSPRARYNDDGWALEQASERLAKQKAAEKFLIPMSDGQPEESPQHSKKEWDLENVVAKIQEETDQKLIALGIGRGTEHVAHYYPNSLANVDVNEMADKLADLLREAIERYDQF